MESSNNYIIMEASIKSLNHVGMNLHSQKYCQMHIAPSSPKTIIVWFLDN